MTIAVVRYERAGQLGWGVLHGTRIAPLADAPATTGELLRQALPRLRALGADQASLPLADLRLLSPVTANQQVICQGINYESHVRESGMDPARIPFNLFFRKASSSLCGAHDPVIRPAHVRLLDYEVELGLVLGRDVTGPLRIGPDGLGGVLAGITIHNDVSARDVQLPQGQFYKGKSYRTFGPTGPILLLLEPHEWKLLPQLRLHLSVNGQVRQDALAGEMLRAPLETLTELSGLQDMEAGDLIATGTPAGCAAKAPGRLPMFIARHFLSEAGKWRLFIKKGLLNPLYLKPGDEMRTSIRTDDGSLDLGEQVNRITAEDRP